MKTFIWFALFCFALAFVSCTEGDVSPATTNTVDRSIESDSRTTSNTVIQSNESESSNVANTVVRPIHNERD